MLDRMLRSGYWIVSIPFLVCCLLWELRKRNMNLELFLRVAWRVKHINLHSSVANAVRRTRQLID